MAFEASRSEPYHSMSLKPVFLSLAYHWRCSFANDSWLRGFLAVFRAVLAAEGFLRFFLVLIGVVCIFRAEIATLVLLVGAGKEFAGGSRKDRVISKPAGGSFASWCR